MLTNIQEIYVSKKVTKDTIILQEVFSGQLPYSELLNNNSPEDVVKMIQEKQIRPSSDVHIPDKVKHIMELSWKFNPSERLTFPEIGK